MCLMWLAKLAQKLSILPSKVHQRYGIMYKEAGGAWYSPRELADRRDGKPIKTDYSQGGAWKMSRKTVEDSLQ